MRGERERKETQNKERPTKCGGRLITGVNANTRYPYCQRQNVTQLMYTQTKAKSKTSQSVTNT